MYKFIIYFFSSFTLATITIPFIIKFSNRYNITDKLDGRKIHTEPISRIGGLAIFLSFIILFLVYILSVKKYILLPFNIYLYLTALILAFLIGFIDDIIKIRARYKLILQIIISFIAGLSGLLITEFSFFELFTINFGYFSYILTIIWIVIFMNAINLIDGMDGLASGIIAIASIFLFAISMLMKNSIVSIISIILLGSIIGFYIFNFPPAKIFMGDGGAYFLGFMYSTIGLMGIKKSSVAIVFIIPIILLLIPVLDILQVAFRRIKEKKNIFVPDKNHIHHRLLDLGFSVKNILFILYLFTIILGVFSLLIVLLPSQYSFTIFILIFLVSFFSFYLLYIFENKVLKINKKDN